MAAMLVVAWSRYGLTLASTGLCLDLDLSARAVAARRWCGRGLGLTPTTTGLRACCQRCRFGVAAATSSSSTDRRA
jgi:hypothetical protein